MYILICAYDGLIEVVEFYEHDYQATQRAEELWQHAYPKDDDVKVFDEKGNEKCAPPDYY